MKNKIKKGIASIGLVASLLGNTSDYTELVDHIEKNGRKYDQKIRVNDEECITTTPAYSLSGYNAELEGMVEFDYFPETKILKTSIRNPSLKGYEDFYTGSSNVLNSISSSNYLIILEGGDKLIDGKPEAVLKGNTQNLFGEINITEKIDKSYQENSEIKSKVNNLYKTALEKTLFE